MITQEQEEKIRSGIKGMRAIANTTRDPKERFYYWGQIDGVIGLLEILGEEIELEKE